MAIQIYNLETNRPVSDLVVSEVYDSTFDSTALNALLPFFTQEFKPYNFIYGNFNLTNQGSGIDSWLANEIQNGMFYPIRYGIGYFYFLNVSNDIIEPVSGEIISEEISPEIKYWDWLTTFWDYLSEKDREMFENYWHGLKMASDSLNKKANRLLDAIAPEMSNEVIFEDYYEVPVGPLVSKPLNPDPTLSDTNYFIHPLNKILIDPAYDSDLNPIFHDMIEISASDYYKIRNIGLNCYIVIKVDNTSISDKYFKVSNLMSSEERPDSGRYYPPVNSDSSNYKYMIVVSGNLAYIGNNTFSIYFTTGKAYDIDSWVLALPILQTHITPGYPVEFQIDRDYTVSDNIVEFNHDIFASNEVSINNTILYCPKTSIIEYYLYDLYGKMINMSDWSLYNHDQYSGKTAINSIMKGLQDGSNLIDYTRALNAFYGMPIAPKNSKVIGLYESYDYIVTDINGNKITVELSGNAPLHPFIQSATKFNVTGKKEIKVNYVEDRSIGTIVILDASYLSIGDKLNIKLKNRFSIKDIVAETETNNAYITVYTDEGPYAIQHLIDIIQKISNYKKYPEMIIYNTENFTVNYNGIYHITSVEPIVNNEGLIKLNLYKTPDKTEPLYNDYIGTDFDNIGNAKNWYVHIPWPTHKFLYLLMDNSIYYKAYLDAPIDTIYESEDKLEKYQIIARNVSVIIKSMFPDWNQFDCFKKYTGINFESDILELTRIIPGGSFGSYFPSQVV